MKTNQMFSIRTAPEEFKNVPITGHFRFMFAENNNHMIILTPSFSRSSVFKMFSVRTKTIS